jgi:NADP-dependent 3-hydroxy acid dehydrogenase YdfG
MKGKIALVTGASSGIGAATALLLAREGASVAAVARRADRLEELVHNIAAAGGRGVAFAADVADRDSGEAVFQQVLAHFGQVDILVNSAGIMRPGNTETSDPGDWRDMFDINVLGTMYMSRAALPGMRERRDGHIVIVSSTAGRYAAAGNVGYSASKHAVNAFSEAMRQEVAAHGIRVTLIEPGATSTEVAQSIPDPNARDFIAQHVSKTGSMCAEDVGGAILYVLKQPPNVNVRELWIAPTSAVR